MSNKKDTVLNPESAALVIHEDGTIEMMLPKGMVDAEIIPGHVAAIVALGGRFIKDQAWREELMAWFEDQEEVFPIVALKH